MTVLRTIFSAEKPLIGMVHLDPMPGSPGYSREGGMERVVERALKDAAALQSGGVDGIMVENFGDTPFYPQRVPPITVSAITWVIAQLARKIRIPMGVNVLRNDVQSGLSIAAATGARFVRVNVHIGAVVTDQGIVEGEAHDSVRLREAIDARHVAIFADIAVKHAGALGEPRPLEREAHEAARRGLADAVILTGTATGQPGTPWEIRSVKADLGEVPVLAGSGVDPETVGEFLEVADGVIVGSSLKHGGIATNPVDPARVRAFVRAARRVRA